MEDWSQYPSVSDIARCPCPGCARPYPFLDGLDHIELRSGFRTEGFKEWSNKVRCPKCQTVFITEHSKLDYD